MCRLKQLDRIAVGVVQLDLLAAWSYFHFISKLNPALFQTFNSSGQIVNLQNNSVPATRFLLSPIGK